MTRSLPRLVLFLLILSTAAHLSAADEKMFYTSEWTKLDDPKAKGRQMVVVIHNTPQGEHKAIVKFLLGGEFPIAYAVTMKDGTTLDIGFLKPPGGNILRQPVRIKSVKWDGKDVPAKLVNAKNPDNEAKNGKDKNEERAASFLKFAKKLVDDGMAEKAKERLREIVEKFPGTKAATEAMGLLEKLPKK